MPEKEKSFELSDRSGEEKIEVNTSPEYQDALRKLWRSIQSKRVDGNNFDRDRNSIVCDYHGYLMFYEINVFGDFSITKLDYVRKSNSNNNFRETEYLYLTKKDYKLGWEHPIIVEERYKPYTASIDAVDSISEQVESWVPLTPKSN